MARVPGRRSRDRFDEFRIDESEGEKTWSFGLRTAHYVGGIAGCDAAVDISTLRRAAIHRVS
jgi:hypothetical protein